MKHRVVDYVLFLAVLVGGFLAVKTGLERLRLRREYDRLTQFVSDLSISDPNQLHVRALDTGEPLHFAWRIYFPPKYQFVVRDRFGGSSSTFRDNAYECIVRVRFREDQDYLQIHTQFPGSSGRMSAGDRELTKLLHDRWDQIQVQQLGDKEQATIARDRNALLLRLTLPEDLVKEAKKQVPSPNRERYVPVLFELELTPP